MNFLRALLASLLSLVCTLAVSGFVTLQTLNATLLDRAEVKTWLSDSGVYNNLLGTVLASNPSAQDQVEATGSGIAPDTLKTALVATFQPSFVQQSSEKVLDGVYNWLDSKATDIQFEINTTDHKETFVQKLSALLEPQLAAMPRCASLAQFDASNPTCLPPGSTAKQAADAMAIDASNRISIFNQPLNTQNVSDVTKTQNQSAQTPANPSRQIPELISAMRMWLVWLPLIAIASGGLMVLLSRLHLRAAKHLAGRLTFGLAVTFVLGLVVANVGKTLKIGDYYAAGSSAVTTNIAEPILHQAAPAMGNYLAMVSGIAGAMTLALWIVLRVIYKRRERAELLRQPEEIVTPAVAKPSQTSAPSAPQSAQKPTSPPKDEQK